MEPKTSSVSVKTANATKLDVEVLRTRLLVLTSVVIAVIAGILVDIDGGVTLKTFHYSGASDDPKREALVDDYNSYSANVASLFCRPIEALVDMVVCVVVLRFATKSLLKAGSSWLVSVFVLVSVAGLEYLVLNGFNALNVQSSPVGVQPVISVSDLSLVASGNDSIVTENVTVWNATFSESALENPIANTVLRNLLLPKVSKPNARNRPCSAERDYFPRDDMINYGFPTRIWQRNMLPTALKPTVLRMPIKSDTEIDPRFTQGLPMNASRAADLFVTGAYLVGEFSPWFQNYFIGYGTMKPRIPPPTNGESVTLSAVDLIGLLLDHRFDEQAQRVWFLKRSRDIMANEFHITSSEDLKNEADNALALEFAHVNISPTITFDAVSFEVEVISDQDDDESTQPHSSMGKMSTSRY